jgi:RNA polymerase sigma factor for flagellar operon FliA
MTASPRRRDEMFLLHQGLVRAIAWKTHQRVPHNVEIDDLIAYGQIGLLEAITAFDAERGRKFTTFAWHRIRGAILDGLGTMSWFNRAKFERSEYEQPAASAPTAAGAAAAAPSAASTTATPATATPAAARGRRPTRSGLEDVPVMSREPDAGDDVLKREMIAFMRDLVGALPEKEAGLLRGVFFEGRTLTEAARRVGISTAWASRLQTRTLADLRVALERNGYD